MEKVSKKQLPDDASFLASQSQAATTTRRKTSPNLKFIAPDACKYNEKITEIIMRF